MDDMSDDEIHEATGAMIHRGLVEAAALIVAAGDQVETAPIDLDASMHAATLALVDEQLVTIKIQRAEIERLKEFIRSAELWQ
jgi:hypothetical protein